MFTQTMRDTKYKSHNNRCLSYVRHSYNKRQHKIDFDLRTSLCRGTSPYQGLPFIN